jgi:hypothetical protein
MTMGRPRRPAGRRGDLCVRRQGGVIGPGNFPALISLLHLQNRAPFAALAMTMGTRWEAGRPGPGALERSGTFALSRSSRIVSSGGFPARESWCFPLSLNNRASVPAGGMAQRRPRSSLLPLMLSGWFALLIRPAICPSRVLRIKSRAGDKQVPPTWDYKRNHSHDPASG